MVYKVILQSINFLQKSDPFSCNEKLPSIPKISTTFSPTVPLLSPPPCKKTIELTRRPSPEIKKEPEIKQEELDEEDEPVLPSESSNDRTATPPSDPVDKAGKSGKGAAKSGKPSAPRRRRKKANDEDRDLKRPMNGFMLFAKTMRVELTKCFPGKDNR